MESRLVCVEADVGDGLPQFSMVGDLSAQVREAQERVRSALRNSGRTLRPQRITVNLSPADLRKYGSGYDLAIAVAVASGYGELKQEKLSGILIIGELSLNGEVRSVPGILPIAADARKYGCHTCIVPYENMREAMQAEDIKVVGVRSLQETLLYLQGKWNPAEPPQESDTESEMLQGDFSEIHGQQMVRRAAEVAAAGGHNMLMVGPPGSGKSMIAQRIATILPPLSQEEQMEVSRIYSAASLVLPKGFLLYNRPFRSPHHTVTGRALSGGGNLPRPGELSLAHNGVLFLDELPEFSRDALEILRQPLEEGKIAISRVSGSYVFPAEVMLIAAMNPCPCGHFGNLNKCTCTYPQIRRYLSRISSPLLDRIDITVEAAPLGFAQLETEKREESSAEIRERVIRARRIQEHRYTHSGVRCNARLGSKQVEEVCSLGSGERRLLQTAFEKLDLSVRSYYRILRVARTIADLEGREDIMLSDLEEALCYRSIHQKYWQGR